MTTRTTAWPAGIPCWTDLTTPDVPAAKAFYSAVLGWSFAETDPEYGGYTIAQVDGRAAAAIGPQHGDAPPAWTLYLASDDADKTAAAISEHGGTVLLPPGDVGPMGRMCIAADPAGAVFGVWQARGHIGAEVTSLPGSLAWEDLRSTDADGARRFYTGVFGYDTQPLAAAGPDYRLFMLPGDPAPLGGMGGMMGQTGAPSHWIVYFGVADTQVAVRTAGAAGGTVVREPFDTPYGSMAALTDPAGVPFWVVQTDGSNQPDRSD
jgi:hypothetical protein